MARSSYIVEQAECPQFLRQLSPGICYALASVALFAPWVGYYLFDPFGFDAPVRDTWHHVAVLRELMASPFAPSNPHIPTGEPSRYFTPINVVAAMLGNLFGLSPYTLFGVMGAATCVGLVMGCWVFARRYYGTPWSPLALLLCLLFVWGLQRGHVGLHNYATFLTSAAYPSTIVFVLGFFQWAMAIGSVADQKHRVIRLVALAGLSALTLITHQLSGAITGVIAASLVVFRPRANASAKAASVTAMALGGLLTLAWPYFNVLDVLSSTSDPRWRAVNTIEARSTALALAAPALIGILGFRKGSNGWRHELLMPALFFALTYTALEIQGSAIAHRLFPAVILLGQLGVVWFVLEYLSRDDRPWNLRIVIAAALCLVCLVSAGQIAIGRLHDLKMRASDGSLRETAESMAEAIGLGSIVFATENIVFPLQSTGIRVVSIPRPEPVAPSLAARQAATDRFFDRQTSQPERRKLIARWQATHAAFTTTDLQAATINDLRKLGSHTKLSNTVEVVTFNLRDTGSASHGNGQ